MIFGPFRTISSNNIQALMALLSEKGQPLDPMVCPGGLMCSRSCAILWVFQGFSIGFATEFPVPSGKLTKNYGKSPCLMGKSTIYLWPF